LAEEGDSHGLRIIRRNCLPGRQQKPPCGNSEQQKACRNRTDFVHVWLNP
jgi:hypothetical protein